MSPRFEGPKRAKGVSKKNKKSWRKNTDINEIEEFLDDQRLEVRLGGSFDTRKDDELFTVTSQPQTESELKGSKRRKRGDKPLKCFQHLTNTSKVPDPIVSRNRTRTVEERRNPIVVKKEENKRLQGIVKQKDKLIQKHREAEKSRKAATLLERTTRRRTEFDFDLWDAPELKIVKKVNDNEWLEASTKNHMLINLGNVTAVKKPPKDLRERTSKLAVVEPPHPGSSYNPSLKDHNDLLWKAAVVELMKEKEQHRIDFHTTMMFPSKKDAPTEKSWLAEMSEGVEVLSKRGKASIQEEDNQGSDEEGQIKADGNESSETDDGLGLEPKPKTRKQRRKAKERRNELLRKATEKSDNLRELEVFRIRSIKKELNEKDIETQRRQLVKKVKKEQKQFQPAQLCGNRFEPQEIELKLTDELTGNLRSLKPEGNVLLDRYKSLQKRNIIETRIKQKIVKNKKKRKKLEKRSYKMGFDWEKK